MSDGTVHNLYIRARRIRTAESVITGFWRRPRPAPAASSGSGCSSPMRGAIRFYERHGFVTMRKTDGRENEEKVPDRLMAWRVRRSSKDATARPIGDVQMKPACLTRCLADGSGILTARPFAHRSLAGRDWADESGGAILRKMNVAGVMGSSDDLTARREWYDRFGK